MGVGSIVRDGLKLYALCPMHYALAALPASAASTAAATTRAAPGEAATARPAGRRCHRRRDRGREAVHAGAEGCGMKRRRGDVPAVRRCGRHVVQVFERLRPLVDALEDHRVGQVLLEQVDVLVELLAVRFGDHHVLPEAETTPE